MTRSARVRLGPFSDLTVELMAANKYRGLTAWRWLSLPDS